jgi:hypothetical protein
MGYVYSVSHPLKIDDQKLLWFSIPIMLCIQTKIIENWENKIKQNKT